MLGTKKKWIALGAFVALVAAATAIIVANRPG